MVFKYIYIYIYNIKFNSINGSYTNVYIKISDYKYYIYIFNIYFYSI